MKTSIIRTLLVAAAFACTAASPAFAQAKGQSLNDAIKAGEFGPMKCVGQPAAPIPIIGCTPDGKYPIYQIEGNRVDDTKYTINTPKGDRRIDGNHILTHMKLIEPADVKKYKCDTPDAMWCVDSQNRPVGINPGWAKIQGELRAAAASKKK